MALAELSARFKRSGITFALGGSGLLHALGLTHVVHDWDITTDAGWAQAEAALKGLQYERRESTTGFAADYWCKIAAPGAAIDLLGRFALRDGPKIHSVKTIVTGEWRGIPLGSPREWQRVYELLGHADKAQVLRNYLGQKPARATH